MLLPSGGARSFSRSAAAERLMNPVFIVIDPERLHECMGNGHIRNRLDLIDLEHAKVGEPTMLMKWRAVGVAHRRLRLPLAGREPLSSRHATYRRVHRTCMPTLAAKPHSGPGWVQEIKHDGYRLIVRRDGLTVRLFTRRGYDWTDRYPVIAAAGAKLRVKSFTLDGEAVVVGHDGVAVFDALHRRHKASEALLYAFDLLERTGRTCGPGHSATARRGWRGYWRGRRPGSSTTSTPRRMAPWCSGTPAGSGSKASCRSD
jgi:ATP dependent DNA ligase domain